MMVEFFCTQEAKLCNDGSYVSRNSGNNCQFDPCPDIEHPIDLPNPDDQNPGESATPKNSFFDKIASWFKRFFS